MSVDRKWLEECVGEMSGLLWRARRISAMGIRVRESVSLADTGERQYAGLESKLLVY